MSKIIDLFAELDKLAPGWQIPNETTETSRAMLVTRALNDSDYDFSLWVGIREPSEAMITRLTLFFDEFGEAVWNENKLWSSIGWFRPYSYTKPGWDIKE